MDFERVYLVSIWILMEFYVNFNGACETFFKDSNRIRWIIMENFINMHFYFQIFII